MRSDLFSVDPNANESTKSQRKGNSKKDTKKQPPKKKVTKKQPPKKKQEEKKNNPPKKSKKQKKKKDEKKPEKKPREKADPNQTFTTIKVGLGGHCTNEGMRRTLEEWSLFVSQSANQAGLVMNYIFTLLSETDDSVMRNDIETLLQKYVPTKDSFSYACMNVKSKFYPLVPEPYDCCNFQLLDGEGQGALFNTQARLMAVNIQRNSRIGIFTKSSPFGLRSSSHLVWI